MEKCAVFIDGGYLQKVLVRYSNASIDYQKFSTLLSDNCPILRTYYYNCMPYWDATQPTVDQIERFTNCSALLINYET